MQSKATTVAAYLAELPPERRAAIEIIRGVIRKNIDKTYEEGMLYGMPGFYVPHSVYPPGYHCDPRIPLPFVGFAAQKNYISVYVPCYMDPAEMAWFQKAYKGSGKKLDMGKCCVRVKKVEDLALDVIGESIRRLPAKKFIALYAAGLEKQRSGPSRKPAAKAKSNPAAKKPTTRSVASRRRAVKGARAAKRA